MPLLTIVQEYIYTALKHATVETMEDGTLMAYVPEIRGIVAFGADVHECARELSALLEEWVQVSLAKGHELPVIDDINLNDEAERILMTYHRPISVEQESGEFFDDEEKLAAAFDRHSKTA